jgi:TPR repeat protein
MTQNTANFDPFVYVKKTFAHVLKNPPSDYVIKVACKEFLDMTVELTTNQTVFEDCLKKCSGECLYLLAVNSLRVHPIGNNMYNLCIWKAIEKKCREAMLFHACRLIKNDDELAKKLFRQAYCTFYEHDDVKEFCIESAHQLALYLRSSKDPEDIKEMITMMERSAKYTKTSAQLQLGTYYFEIKEYEKAIHWLKIARDNGHPNAQNCIIQVIQMMRRV